jgi:membrane fusion protein (multidrug efflux system)
MTQLLWPAGRRLAAICLVCLAAGQTGTAAAQTAAAPPQVGIIAVSQQPVYNESTYVGRIQSPGIVQLNARVTGYLEQQNFHDGDDVTAGQLLYVIEQPPYQAQLTQAQANLDQALAQARNASLTFSRAQALLHTAAGQQSVVDSAQAGAGSAAAAIAAARAQLQIAQINLGYTEIRAPIAGQISATTVNPGNVVGPTSGALATIVAQDPMYVTFSLPVLDALKFRANVAGLDLLVQLPDGSLYNQTGRVDFINNQISQDTDTLTWRGTIANPPLQNPGNIPGASRTLTSGEFITVILRQKTPIQAIEIPRDAVITDQLGDYVLKLTANNILARQPVTMGPQTNNSVQITAGLQPGDKIVTSGIQRVHAGSIVNPQPAASN